MKPIRRSMVLFDESDFLLRDTINSLANGTINSTVNNQSNDFFISEPNQHNISVIKDYLNGKLPTDTAKILYIRGTIGCGKSTLVKRCIEELGLRYEEFNQEFDDSPCSSMTDLYRVLTTTDISLFFGNSKKAVIIIEDFENSLRKFQQTDFFNFIKKQEHIPPVILLASEPKYSKETKIP